MTTIGAVCGDPTPLEALNELGASQSLKVHVKERELLEEISPGPPQEVGIGRSKSVKRNSNTCRTDTRQE